MRCLMSKFSKKFLTVWMSCIGFTICDFEIYPLVSDLPLKSTFKSSNCSWGPSFNSFLVKDSWEFEIELTEISYSWSKKSLLYDSRCLRCWYCLSLLLEQGVPSITNDSFFSWMTYSSQTRYFYIASLRPVIFY